VRSPRWIAFLGLVAAAIAQVPEPPSCCSAAVRVPLPPLAADATAKERWLRTIHDESADDAANIFLSTRYIDGLRARLLAVKPDAPLTERFGARWGLAQALLRTGDLEEAVGLCRQCVRLCEENPGPAAAWLPEVLLRLGAIWFRQAEKQNCIARHNAESCILPLSPRAVHVDKEGAEAAREVLMRLLALPQSDLRLEAVWLLNIAHMALGDWPDGVPSAHRIPAAAFAPEVAFPRMHERGAWIGLGHHHHAGSVVIDDFTGDGRFDVLTCSFDTGVVPRLLRREPDGRFADVAVAAGLGRQLGGVAAVHGDVDGDGRLDVLLLRGGGFFAGSAWPPSLLRQDAPGHFVDVTAAAGLEFAAPARTAAFADADRDGDLDLFVGCESERDADGAIRHGSRLFANDGAGRFTDVTAASGVATGDRVVGAVFADFDGDLLPDLYVSNFLAGNRLFMNRGGMRFVDEAEARGVRGPEASGPCCVLDHDQDGDLDLFVTYHHHYRQIRSVAAWYVERRVEDDHQRLWANDGTGRFTDATAVRGLRRVCMATGVNTGDIDNDGFPDLYITTGAHDLAALFPNVLLLGGESFRDATFAAGVGHLQKGNGVAFADLDEDGDLDLAAQVGGFHLDDGFGSVLFENTSAPSPWLAIELRGVTDNRFGVGARVRARVAGPRGERDVWATIGAGGSLGCNPLRAHLGLGGAHRVEFVEVRWPRSGAVQRVTGVAPGCVWVVTQGIEAAERAQRPSLPLPNGG